MEKQSFDFEAFKKQATTRIRNGETLLGKEGMLTPLLSREFLFSCVGRDGVTVLSGYIVFAGKKG